MRAQWTFDVGVGRVGRAGVELQFVAAGDVDQGERRRPAHPDDAGAGVVRSSSGIQVPLPQSHSEEAMVRSGTCSVPHSGNGVGDCPVGPAAGLPAGGVAEVVQVELLRVVRVRAVQRRVDRLPAAHVVQMIAQLLVQLQGLGNLREEKWQKRLTDADRRALPPLFWTHANPYGRFELDMNNRLDLTQAATVPGLRTTPATETVERGHPAEKITA